MNLPAATPRHDQVKHNPEPVQPRRRTSTIAAAAAAAAGAVGGLALFFDLSLHLFAPLDRSYFVVATVMALCLLGVPTAYWLRGAIGSGWKRLLGAAGASLVILGAAAWITAFVILFNNPDAAFTQRLTPTGSVLMALGMLLLGIGILASQRLTGTRRFAPLLVGVYFPAQLIIQLTFFLNGNDAAPGPNGALLGSWGLLWAWAAWASVTAKNRNQNRP